MAKFTQEQIEQAKAEFFQERGDEYLEFSVIPAAGNNGPITVYNKVEEDNGNGKAASD